MEGSNWEMPVLNWVIEFMRECAEELKVTPSWEVLMKRGRVMMRGSVGAVKDGCVSCREEVEKLPLFAERIGRQVEFAISEVRFEWGVLITVSCQCHAWSSLLI